MSTYLIHPTPVLHGEAQINTSKNAVLPIMAGALLCQSPVVLHDTPDLTDVRSMADVLTACGARVERTGYEDHPQ